MDVPREFIAVLGERFQIEVEIGRGAHKRVYKAWDRKLERLVAIAALPIAKLANDRTPLDEARAMARIGDHPRLVSVYDVIEAKHEVFIVSRFLAEGDLRALLRSAGRLPVSRAVDISADIAAALAHAHANQLIHQDVKPENVFLEGTSHALLGDLGFAQVLSARVSQPYAITGSFAYIAPEQFLSQPISAATDVYALGCVLYEMLVGEPPITSPSVAEHVSRLLDGELPVRPRQIRPDVPPLLDDLVMQALERDPAVRIASSDDLAASLLAVRPRLAARRPERNAADTVQHDDAESVPIRGWDPELRALDMYVDEVREGRARILLVEDDPGSGKTRFLRALVEKATASGYTVLDTGENIAGETAFASVSRALRPLLTRIPRDGPAAILRPIIDAGRNDEANEPHSGAGNATALAAAVTILLQDVATERPIVLVIDDIHLLDSASLKLVVHLAALLSGSNPPPLLIAAAGTPVEAPVTADLLRLLRCEAATTAVSLRRLDENAVAQTITARGIATPSPQLIRFVFSVSGGLPLMVHETISHLMARRAIEHREGFATLRAEVLREPIPSSVYAFASSKLIDLPPATLTALRMLAALQRPTTLDQLARLLDSDPKAVQSDLTGAYSARLVQGDEAQLRILHSQLRQAIYSALPSPERESLHLRIADHLCSIAETGEAPDPAAVAHHLIRAGHRADAAATVRYCSAAGDLAVGRFAWAEAAELFEAALNASDRIADPSPSAKAELHRKAGISHFQLYDRGLSIYHLDRAIEAFRTTGDRRGLLIALHDRARAAVQSGMVSYGEMQSVEPLEECLQSGRDVDDALRALVLGTLAEAYWIARKPERAAELADEALAIASDSGNDPLLAEMCIHRALAHLQRLELRDALDIYEEGIAAARASNHVTALEQCLTRHAMVSLLLGHTANAETTAAEAQRFNRITQSGDESWTYSTMTTLAAIRGDNGAAERHAAAGLALIERAKYPWSGAVLCFALAHARAIRGDASRVNQAIDLFVRPGFILDDPAPLDAYVVQYRALAALYAGQEAPAVAPLDIDSEIDPVTGFDFMHVPTIAAAVELWSLGHAPRPSDRCLACLDLAADRGVVFSIGWPFMVPRILTVAAVADQRWDEAIRQGQKALEFARRIRAAPEVALTAHAVARALRRRGADGDSARADRLLERNAAALRDHLPPGIAGRE